MLDGEKTSTDDAGCGMTCILKTNRIDKSPGGKKIAINIDSKRIGARITRRLSNVFLFLCLLNFPFGDLGGIGARM